MAGEYSHEEARAALEEATLLGMHVWAEAVLGEAIRQAPVVEGTLRGSGTIEEHGTEIWIIFALIYAAYQHEGMRADGSYVVQEHTMAGTKTKFLEDPVKMFAPKLGPAVAAAQRRALGRSGGMTATIGGGLGSPVGFG